MFSGQEGLNSAMISDMIALRGIYVECMIFITSRLRIFFVHIAVDFVSVISLGCVDLCDRTKLLKPSPESYFSGDILHAYIILEPCSPGLPSWTVSPVLASAIVMTGMFDRGHRPMV